MEDWMKTAIGVPRRAIGAAIRAPMHIMDLNPGGILRDVVNIVSPQTTPALKSESAGLNTAVTQGSKFIGNNPQEIRQAGRQP